MPSYAYFHKKIVPLAEAKVGVMTHAMHYGTAIFEGIRGNWNSQQKQMYIFCLKEHYQRLLNGCKGIMMKLDHSVDELCQITVELAQKCGFEEDVYIRPLAYKGEEAVGVRLHNIGDDFTVFIIPMGRYIDVDKAKCMVASWQRPGDNAAPPMLKIGGNYVSNALAKSDALMNGFDEAIMLAPDGHVSEGSGENIFLVINGKLVTPAIYNNILPGITRDCVIQLARNELSVETVERPVDRAELYLADECFLSGTAAHLTPVVEIDRRPLGNGEIGEITGKLQKIYSDVILGNNPKYMDWCTPVYNK